MYQLLRARLDNAPFGLDFQFGIELAHRMRRSPTVWVLAATLVPALIFTPITRFLYPEWWQLMGYFWYSIPSSSFVYLPHEPSAIYAGAIYSPGIVAITGGLAAIVAAITDYFVVRRVFEFERIAPLKQATLYKRAVRYFNWKPWPTLMVIAFSPIPFYPLRILAPSSGYPLWKYVSAYAAGRVPRCYLLAMGGAWMPVPNEYILLMLVGLIVIPLGWAFWMRRRVRTNITEEAAPHGGSP